MDEIKKPSRKLMAFFYYLWIRFFLTLL